MKKNSLTHDLVLFAFISFLVISECVGLPGNDETAVAEDGGVHIRSFAEHLEVDENGVLRARTEHRPPIRKKLEPWTKNILHCFLIILRSVRLSS
jgi:hypothetical protein